MKKLLLLLMAAVLVLVTCSRDGDNDPAPKPQPTPAVLKEIKISEPTLSLKIGEKHQFKVTFSPSDAPAPAYIWETDNPEVATIDNSGLLTALKDGSASITVSTSDKKFSSVSKVTVAQIDAESVTFDSTMISIRIEETKQLTYKIAPENTTNKSVSFSSNNTNIATVDSTGLVRGINLGETEISIKTANNLSAKTTIKVLPILATQINVDKPNISILVGESTKVNATVLPENTTDKKTIWTSSNESIATVSSDGYIKGIAPGKTQIYARTENGAQAKVEVTVKAIEVTSVTINKTTLELQIGAENYLSASIQPDNATDKNIIWTSSNENIATVSRDGKVTAISPGNCEINARSANGKMATCKVKVLEIQATSISMSHKSIELAETDYFELTVRFDPTNTTNKNVRWTSSDSRVATVTNGRVQAIREGTATITATTEDGKLTATTQVNVVLKGLQLSYTSLTFMETAWHLIHVTKTGSGEAYTKPVWTSSDPGIATVESDGPNTNSAVITGVSPGTATIYASTPDGRITTACNVTIEGVDTYVGLELKPSQDITYGAGYTRIKPVLEFTNNLPEPLTIQYFAVVDNYGNAIHTNALDEVLEPNYTRYRRWNQDLYFVGSYGDYQAQFSRYIGVVLFSYKGKDYSAAAWANPHDVSIYLKDGKKIRALTKKIKSTKNPELKNIVHKLKLK